MARNTDYQINYITNRIIIGKKFAKAAGILNSPEYKILKQLRADYPECAIELKEIAKKAKKLSYANLTYDAMRTYITVVAGEKSPALRNFETVIDISKGQSGKYAYVKKWFLYEYPNYKDAMAAMANSSRQQPNLAIVK
ncbi:MAG: hypothetical protein GX096_05960 [Clostridiales bacterium]|nr:hypothetical protein [Clostridiales bacterium]